MLTFYWGCLKNAFSHSYAIASAVGFILSLIAPLILKRFPEMETSITPLIWKIPLIVFSLVLLAVLLIAPYSMYKESQDKIREIERNQRLLATPDDLRPNYLRGLSIRIADLVREDIVIRNKTFEDCHIYGPAVIFPKDSLFFDIGLVEVNKESLIIEVKENSVASGVIGLENCVFRRCVFHKIAFIGPPALKEKIFKSFRAK